MSNFELVTLLFSAIALALSLYLAILKRDTSKHFSADRFARLETRVEVMWVFLMRRGMAEGLTAGIFQQNSPVKLADRVYEENKEFFDALRQHYVKHWRHLSDVDLVAAIEIDFYPELLQKICKPYNVIFGACLMAAAYVCRPEMKYFNPEERGKAAP